MYVVRAARAEIQRVFFIVCSRLSAPHWPLKNRRLGHFKGVLVLVIYHLVALVELLAAILRVRTQERACGPKGNTRAYKKLWALPNKGWGKKWITHIYGQTPESDIPPSYRATRRYTKIHLGFCLRFSTLIGQIGRVPLFGAGPRRYIRSRLFRLAVTAFWLSLIHISEPTRPY